jgi:alkylhydroperoxidase/carboxymuconolactone decarboxylase family protein YurZ
LRDRIAASYEASFGFVPEAVERRIRVWERLDPELIERVEAIRRVGTTPAAIDAKTAQLVTFGILLAQGNAGARNHALAAQRLGATAAELGEVAVIAFVNAGLGALNLGAEAIEALFPELS